MNRRRPALWEFFTKTRRHLALATTGHAACGRPLEVMHRVGRADLPWPEVGTFGLPRCQTCRRVLRSGGLGFYVTPRGNILTEEDIEALSEEAAAGYDIRHLEGRPTRRHLRQPVQIIGHEPGPDAMRWVPT